MFAQSAAQTVAGGAVAGPTPLPHVTSGLGASQPAASATAAAAAASVTTEVCIDDFMSRLQKAIGEGSLNDVIVGDIKSRFSEPFSSTPKPAVSGMTAPAAAGTTGLMGSQAMTTKMPGQTNSSTSLFGNVTHITSAAETQQKNSNAHHVRRATEFLNVLLMCESGFNNSYDIGVPTQDREAAAGLHAAVAAVATASASSIVAYIKKVVTSSTLTSSIFSDTLQSYVVVHTNAPTEGIDGSASGAKQPTHSSNPVLLAAQCLYVLTRHFQMQPAFVKDVLELIDLILEQIKVDMNGRDIRFSLFRDAPETAPVCSLTWLAVFSCVNALTTWKKLRSISTGKLEANALLRSDVGTAVGNAIRAMRYKYEIHSMSADNDGASFLPTSLGGALGSAAAAAAAAGAGNMLGSSLAGGRPSLRADGKILGGYGNPACRWLAVVEGFISILTLAEGCFLRSKGDDKGYDKAMEAFLGDRETNRTTMVRGKVTKRMVQLAPSPATLYIPIEYVYIAPYEILSYLFDDMLPLLRHLAELEVNSCVRYVNQLQQLDELPRHLGNAAGWYRVGTNGMLVYGTNNNNSEENGAVGASAAMTAGGKAAASTFTSEMAHTLECLAVCLANLPPEVLNPDLDADCAATFFIFRNCVKHMSQIFKVQRGASVLWENFTLKLVTQFVSVLTMIARNPQYIERVVATLSGAQAECEEMQWGSLITQALECAGFNTSGGGSGGMMMQGLMMSGTTTEDMYMDRNCGSGIASMKQQGGAVHRQFTRDHSFCCQREFISCFFLFLRQMFTHPTLRHAVREYLSLELSLSFIFAPRVSQSMLGSTLSLISALITDATDAALVWNFLEQHRLLQAPQFNIAAAAAMTTGAGKEVGAYFTDARGVPRYNTGRSEKNGSAATTAYHDETFSLVGHCQYECTQGTYSITIGFLNLMIALFRYDTPSMSNYATYTGVANFIAQDIFRGVCRRAFADEQERYSVLALAAAALRQSLLVRFTSEGPGAVIPFTTIMATSKAPNDVLGEALTLVLRASTAPYELMSHQRAAVRQCLRLIIAAIHAAQAQRLEIFSFDTRTIQNVSLALNLMALCGTGDSQLINAVLELLLLFPHATMTQASRLWHADSARFANVISTFAVILHPGAHVPPTIMAPPELAILDYDSHQVSPPTPEACAAGSASLVLDLLIEHASIPEPSTTAWLCGFYAAIATSFASGGANDTSMTAKGVTNTAVLNSILTGASSREVEQENPTLTVKYVKLLYVLRANRLYGAGIVRNFISIGSQSLFLRLQQFRPDQCSPIVLLSKYAYVLKLLALEACYAYHHTPEQLCVDRMTISSIPIEVLLSLLSPSDIVDDASAAAAALSNHSGQGGDKDKEGDIGTHTLLSRERSADITQWLTQALRKLPTFPTCGPISAASTFGSTMGNMYVARAADGVVQFNIKWIYDALQLEQVRHQLPLLTMSELRERLMPYIEANECFLVYASAVNFVEGWCQLVDISCSVVKGIPLDRMRQLVTSILAGMDATSTMTVAAQEQVAYRLCSTLTTIVAQLKQRVQEVGRTYALNAGDAVASITDADNTMRPPPAISQRNRRSGIIDASTAGVAESAMRTMQYRSATAAGATNGAGGASSSISVMELQARQNARRRPRSAGGSSRSIFATVAGDRSNMLSVMSRAQGTHGTTGIYRSETDGDVCQEYDYVAAEGAANQALLRPLVAATVSWGARIAPVRTDLYASLLCLSMIPGVTIDDIAVYRAQGALFALLTDDICSPPATAAGGINAGLLQSAVTLLVHLLQTSPTLCDSFCNASEGSTDGLGPLPIRCAQALLKNVDVSILGFITRGGCELGPTLWLMRGVFDFLSVISQQHAPQVLRGNLVDLCLSMESWSQSSQAILGHTDEATERLAPGAKLGQNKELLKRLLLGTVRWFNVMFIAVGDAPTFVYQMQDFVRMCRQLIEYVLHSPVANLHMQRITSVSLTLYAELTELLRGLSASFLTEECRVLVREMALPELLLTFAASDFTDANIFKHDATTTLSSEDVIGHDNIQAALALSLLNGAPASDTHRDLIALTVRNLTHFLLRSEYGLRERGSGADQEGSPFPMMRYNADYVDIMVRVVFEVAARIEFSVSASGGGNNSAGNSSAGGVVVTAAAARSSVAAGAVELHEFQLECYIYALHAAVCLLHSFALPLPGGAHRNGTTFSAYLATIPLADMLAALQHAQAAVYSLRNLNADYRAGLAVQQQASGNWAIRAASSLSNNMARSLVAASESAAKNQQQQQQRRGAGRRDLAAGTESAMSRTLLMDGSAPPTPLTSAFPSGAGPFGVTNRGKEKPRGAGMGSAVEGSPGAATSRDRSYTNRLSTVSPNYCTHGGAESPTALSMEVNNGTQRLADVRLVESGDMAMAADTTIGALLPSAIEDATVLQSVVMDVTGAGAMTDPDEWVRSAPASWQEVLQVENAVRNVKISIANAIRAVRAAVETDK